MKNRAVHDWISSQLRQSKGQRILDLGCGYGGMSRRLAADGHSVTAIDIDPDRIRVAKYLGGSAEFRWEDARRMAYADSFDAVLICMVLHACCQSDRASILLRARKAVHREGRVLIVDVAEPRTQTWRSTLTRLLIEGEERAIGLLDPEHYLNFKDFLRNGGITPLVAAQDLVLVEATQFLAGNILATELTVKE